MQRTKNKIKQIEKYENIYGTNAYFIHHSFSKN